MEISTIQEAMQNCQTKDLTTSTNTESCPHCGRCPRCGRSDYHPYPYPTYKPHYNPYIVEVMC